MASPTEKPETAISDFYDALAQDYDQMTSFETRLVSERPFLRLLVEQNGITSAVDAGAGSGFHSILLAQLGVNVTAIDLYQVMLDALSRHAAEKGLSVKVLRTSLHDLPKRFHETVDGLFCMGNTLAHLLDARELDEALVASYQNEEAVGRGIKQSGVAREKLFITTKLWIQSNGYEGTLKAYENSLKRLQLDYIDLYLIHQPFGDVYGEWRAMEELYQQGKVRAIGVSNFYPDRIMDLMIHNKITPAVNQIEVNPFQQQMDTQKFLQDNNVQVEAWAPFAEGRNNIFQNELLLSIAAKHKKSIAQVILRWLVQRGIIALSKLMKSR